MTQGVPQIMANKYRLIITAIILKLAQFVVFRFSGIREQKPNFGNPMKSTFSLCHKSNEHLRGHAFS